MRALLSSAGPRSAVLAGFIFLAGASAAGGCAEGVTSPDDTGSGSGGSGQSTSSGSSGSGASAGSESSAGSSSGTSSGSSSPPRYGGDDASADASGDDATLGDDASGDDAAGDGGSGGDAASGGATDGAGPDASGPPPFVATGTPITGPDGSWTWVDFPGTSCRDGSTAGIAVNFESSAKSVMVFLGGEGACFDPVTCLANAANEIGQQTPAATGVFDRTNPANPVAGWNFVYIPYCTGDVGMGANPNGTVSGVSGTQKFVGYLNLQAFLNRIVPTFSNPSQVLLAGTSAGGFAAALSAPLVQRAFSTVKVALVDDSGPPMSSKYIPSCLEEEWRQTWGFDDSVLKECGAACPDPDNYAIDYAKFLANTYPDRMVGLVESDTDSVISGFFGYGANDCTGSLLTPVSGPTFTAGLVDFRSEVSPLDPDFGTYFPDSSQHIWLTTASLYTETQGGTSLVSWLANIVGDSSVSQVGP